MNVVIENKKYILEYRQTKVNEQIYIEATDRIYIASIHDADDFNWVVIDYEYI
jgi:hypothetical protein